ncbi:MAG: Membrane-bound hydrogenase subunit alpha [Candidatus Heimdallarchaeota archaeon LC_3]|nr:MAG: Membrane-bound hydrogenase subunit alpha [Candidatus Heimdallarchaeota archaeon LC_3]
MTSANRFFWDNRHLKNYLSPFQVELILETDSMNDKLKNIEINLGLNYSGIRKRFAKSSWTTIGENIGRSCPSCGLFHTMGFYQALENALGLTQKIPLHGNYARILFQEWSRVGSFLKIITSVLDNFGVNGLLSIIKKTLFLHNKFSLIYSGRKNVRIADLIQLGGVKIRPSFTVEGELLTWIEELKSMINDLELKIKNNGYFKSLKGLGRMNTKEAKVYSPVGIIARAVGLPYDVRVNDPKNGYESVSINLPASISGFHDILTLFFRYFQEIKISLSLMHEIIYNNTLEKVSLIINEKDLAHESSEGWARIESPGGEINYYIKIDKNLDIIDFTWQSPTLTNWSFFTQRIKGNPPHSFNVLFDISGFCFYCIEE